MTSISPRFGQLLPTHSEGFANQLLNQHLDMKKSAVKLEVSSKETPKQTLFIVANGDDADMFTAIVSEAMYQRRERKGGLFSVSGDTITRKLAAAEALAKNALLYTQQVVSKLGFALNVNAVSITANTLEPVIFKSDNLIVEAAKKPPTQ